MDYFYTPPHLVAHGYVLIDGDEFTHLTHVMRKNVGDTLRVVDGTGVAYDAVITSLEKRAARCEIRERYPRLNESDVELTLAVGLLKNASRFDFLVEKTAELGVTSIIPLLTERTIPRQAKVDRWQKLALAGMKQSCRCVLPQIRQLTSFNDFVSSTQGSPHRIIPHEKASTSLEEWLSGNSPRRSVPSFTLCIGPEGGFSDEEIGRATLEGFAPVNLGPRRLRTETAAIVSSAALLL